VIALNQALQQPGKALAGQESAVRAKVDRNQLKTTWCRVSERHCRTGFDAMSATALLAALFRRRSALILIISRGSGAG